MAAKNWTYQLASIKIPVQDDLNYLCAKIHNFIQKCTLHLIYWLKSPHYNWSLYVGVFDVPGTLARDGVFSGPLILAGFLFVWAPIRLMFLFATQVASHNRSETASFRHVPCDPAEITQKLFTKVSGWSAACCWYIHVYRPTYIYIRFIEGARLLAIQYKYHRYAVSTKIWPWHKKIKKHDSSRKSVCVDFLYKMKRCITPLVFARCSHVILKDHTSGLRCRVSTYSCFN